LANEDSILPIFPVSSAGYECDVSLFAIMPTSAITKLATGPSSSST